MCTNGSYMRVRVDIEAMDAYQDNQVCLRAPADGVEFGHAGIVHLNHRLGAQCSPVDGFYSEIMSIA